MFLVDLNSPEKYIYLVIRCVDPETNTWNLQVLYAYINYVYYQSTKHKLFSELSWNCQKFTSLWVALNFLRLTYYENPKFVKNLQSLFNNDWHFTFRKMWHILILIIYYSKEKKEKKWMVWFFFLYYKYLQLQLIYFWQYLFPLHSRSRFSL